MRSLRNENLSPLDYIGVRWGWFLALGIILAIVGIVACFNLAISSIAVTMCVGFMMIFGGIAQIVQAFSVRGWGYFFLWLLAGILYLLAGFVCFSDPFAATIILTFVLAFFLILAGAIRIIIGFNARHVSGAGWIIFAGIISALLGVMVLIGWPATFYVLGIFLSVDLILQGWGWIAFALGLKSVQS